MSAFTRRALLGSAPVLAVVVALACGRDGSGGSGANANAGAASSPSAGVAVDTQVLAYLSEARALHHEADMKEQAGDYAGAAQAIDRLVHAQRPHPTERVPEVDEVLADAHARLAELWIHAGDPDRAGREVDEGLRHAPDLSYFRGHLFEVDGLVEEARGRALADAGRPDEAQKAKARAVRRFEQAVEMQDEVIARAIGDGRDGTKSDGGSP
jgi:hypothetical protein